MSTDTKIIGGAILISVFVLIGGFFIFQKQEERFNRPLIGQEIPIQGAQHVLRGESHPQYNSNPPTSGWHWGDGVAGAGIHDKEVPDELLIHSMEHGGVIVHYKQDLSAEQIKKITEAYGRSSGKKILVPRKNLDVPVALTSWGRLLKLKKINEESLEQVKVFIETNSGRGPENAPI